jgi:YesN/AraC family two-component response regulator
VREDETIVLLVEDNADLRAFIRDRFDSSFRLIEADNGAEGLEMAIEMVPDLVISDIMMPRMDGYTLCRRLKSDERTSHIPVVLLTAKADRDEKLVGLELGADAYLTKPFDSEELLVRSRNLIEQRRLLRQRFSGTVVLRPSELELESLDRVFLEKALAIIEERMDDEELSVETLAKELFLSRSQLHRKLKALTNQTPTIFIRNTRLERAAQLLNANSASIGEIAYQVGFSSQAYFTKCFRDHFGCTPSEFARQRPLEAADAT